MKMTLKLAGGYNLLFGLWVLGWPKAWFSISGMEEPRYLFLWYGMGMVVGVYGIGYLAASKDPLRHWPIVLVGFLGKTLGPLGFIWAAFQGDLPWTAGWLLIFNDLIWWIPFAMILWAAASVAVGKSVSGDEMSLDQAMDHFHFSDKFSLGEASEKQTIAIVFLRHFGCTFTRQLLKNLESMEQQAQENGARLVLVHMLKEGEEVDYLRADEVARIADPRCELYRAFGLGKGGFLELFGPSVWYRGFMAFFRGCGVGHLAGDGLQMPGAFLIKNRKIIVSRKAQTAADLPEVSGLFTS